MTTMQRDPLVDDYLRRLNAAAADLPRERRAELVGEIEEHVDSALAEAGAHDESTVRSVLERLGTPEEIAAAAGPPPATERGRLELAALIVLSVSFILPVIGYLIGARLVLASKVWDGRDKFLALLIPPVVVLSGAVVVMMGSASIADGDTFDSGLGPVEIAVLLANVFSGFAAASYLSARLRRTAAG
jgi:HAAS